MMMLDTLYDDLEMAHKLYDEVTIHGLHKENQSMWDRFVAESLHDLSRYSCPHERIRY